MINFNKFDLKDLNLDRAVKTFGTVKQNAMGHSV